MSVNPAQGTKMACCDLLCSPRATQRSLPGVVVSFFQHGGDDGRFPLQILQMHLRTGSLLLKAFVFMRVCFFFFFMHPVVDPAVD